MPFNRGILILFNIEEAAMAVGQHVWHFGVGDPNALGWSITVGYLVTAVFCYLRGRQHDRFQRAHHAQFWFMIGLFLVSLGINKQLDLQTLVIGTARSLSIDYGFYQYRHGIAIAFVGGLLLWGAISQAWLYSVLHRLHKTERLALIGLGVLFVFIAARAASFQHLDLFAQSPLLAHRIYALMEILGIGCIAYATYRSEWQVRVPSGGIAAVKHSKSNI